MKKYSFVFAFITMILISCSGSQITTGINDEEAPINTEKIIVHTKLSDSEAYQKAAKFLTSEGYFIDYSDKELKTLSTKPKGVSQRYGVDNVMNSININIVNSNIEISGTFKTLGINDYQTIKKKGQNGSPWRDAWKAMWKLADNMNGEKMTYE